MAALASHISLLLLGVILLTKCSALVEAQFTEEDDGNGVYTVNSFDGLSFSGSNLPVKMTFPTGKAFEITSNSLNLRVLRRSKKPISLSNNQILVGDKLVCEDVKKAFGEITYQKSADGWLWYTNLKIGKPMNKVEIDYFEAEWAKLKNEQGEGEAEREGQRKQRMDFQNQRLKQQGQDRERQNKERADISNARLRRRAGRRDTRSRRQTDVRERRPKRVTMKKSPTFWDITE